LPGFSCCNLLKVRFYCVNISQIIIFLILSIFQNLTLALFFHDFWLAVSV
jgi:hypothetical protein